MPERGAPPPPLGTSQLQPCLLTRGGQEQNGRSTLKLARRPIALRSDLAARPRRDPDLRPLREPRRIPAPGYWLSPTVFEASCEPRTASVTILEVRPGDAPSAVSPERSARELLVTAAAGGHSPPTDTLAVARTHAVPYLLTTRLACGDRRPLRHSAVTRITTAARSG